tara:strand:- start:1686 stop:1811 length:126 start_codon:yes stop_codon:yes gene_type:complete
MGKAIWIDLNKLFRDESKEDDWQFIFHRYHKLNLLFTVKKE